MATVKKNVVSKSNVTVHNTIKIDRNLPPIFSGGGTFTDLGGNSYYPFLAPNDNLSRILLESCLSSPTQSNCINDKIQYSVGDGLQVKDKEFPTDFDKKINGERETLDDILRGVFECYYLYGNVFLEIVRTVVGDEKIVHVYLINNMDCRLEERKDGGTPTHVLKSKNFRQDGIYTFNKEEKKPTRIPLWRDDAADESEIWLKKGKVERTMVMLKNRVRGAEPYGLPSNYSGLLNVLMEWKATSVNLDNFDNNMFIAGVLSIEGGLSGDEKTKLLRGVRNMYTGEGKGQRILVMASEQAKSVKFEPFTKQQEGHFMDFDKHNMDKIISANGWSKDLMDLKESSGLGKGGEYLKQLFKIKFRTAISPVQQVVMNNFIFPLMQIIDEWKGTKFYDMPWYIKSVIPVDMESVLDVNSLLTVDEGREELGKEPLGGEQGKKLISEVKAKTPENKTEKPKKDDTK